MSGDDVPGAGLSGADDELQRAREEIAGLKAALESRGPIEQAKGVVMALYRVDAERAWQVLQEASSHLNVKLRAVATAVVALAVGSGVDPSLAVPVTDRVLRPAATDPVTAAFVARLLGGRPRPCPAPLAPPVGQPPTGVGAPSEVDLPGPAAAEAPAGTV